MIRYACDYAAEECGYDVQYGSDAIDHSDQHGADTYDNLANQLSFRSFNRF
jgi:hypothetical protein